MSLGRFCRFFLATILMFGVLTWCWSIVGRGYGAFFRASGNAMLAGSSERIVTFAPSRESRGFHDTELVVIDVASHLKSTTALSSRRHGYMPTALVIALLLATPISWRARLSALGWGILGINVYIAAKLIILSWAYDPSQLQTTAGGLGTGDSIAAVFLWIVSASSAGWAIIPIVIYAILMFRSTEIRRVFVRP